MANVKITALEHQSSSLLGPGDVFVLDDVTRLVTRKLTVANLLSYTTRVIGNPQVVNSNLVAFSDYANTAISLVSSNVDNNYASLTSSISSTDANAASNYSNLTYAIGLVNTNVTSLASTVASNVAILTTSISSNITPVIASINLVNSNVASIKSDLINTNANVITINNTLVSNVSTLTSSINAATTAINIVNANLVSNVSTLNTATDLVNANLVSNVSTLTSSINAATTAINTVNSNLVSNVSTLTSSINAATTAINIVNANLVSNVSTLNTATDLVNANLVSNVSTLTSSINAATTAINTVNSNLVSNVSTLTSSINAATTAINTVNANLVSKVSTLNTATDLVNANLVSNVSTLTSSINAVNANLVSNISTITASINTVNSNVNTISTNLVSNVAALTNAINLVSSDVSAANTSGLVSSINLVNANLVSNVNTLTTAINLVSSNVSSSNTTAITNSVNLVNANLVSNVSTLTTAINTVNANVSTLTSSMNNAAALVGVVPISSGGTGQNTLPKAMAALKGFTTIASTGGTTTLDATSPENIMVFNVGAVGQTVVLPDVTTLALGWIFTIMNNTGAAVIVQSSGLNAIGTGNQQPGQTARYICIAITGTGTASWYVTYDGATTRTGSGAAVFAGLPQISGASFATTNITAGTDASGQGQLPTGFDTFFITSTATNPSGITLFTGNTTGKRIYVFNKGTNPVNIYPVSGTSIDTLGVNVPISLPVGGSITFNNDTLVHWLSSAYDLKYASSLSGTVPLANGGTGVTSAPAAAAQFIGYTTTVTGSNAGITTLTNTSTQYQIFTGSTTQTINLPVTSTLTRGWRFEIVNNSSSNLTVYSSGTNIIDTVYPSATLKVTCVGTTLTTAADWEYGHGDFGFVTGNGSVVLSTSPSLSSPTLSSPSLSGTPVISNATSGGGAVVAEWVYRRTTNGAAIGPTIADVFTTPSSLSLEATSTYEIEGEVYFLKTTAGAATWTNLFSSAPTLFTMESTAAPVTGMAAATGASYVPLLNYWYAQGATSIAIQPSATTLTTAVNHFFKFRATLITNLACNWRLQLTQTAGTVTPLIGSYYRINKIAASTGTFVA